MRRADAEAALGHVLLLAAAHHVGVLEKKTGLLKV